MTTDTFITLSTFLHLTELRMNDLEIDLDTFDEARLGQLLSLRVLKLKFLELYGSNPVGATFCRIFSRMFPNLQELYVYSRGNYGIDLHLGEFGNLRKHEIRIYEDDSDDSDDSDDCDDSDEEY